MSTKTSEGLKREIGVWGLTLGIVNGVIGAGIFALPAIVGVQLNTYAFVGYLFCGLMLASIMLCYAEVGSIVTSSGGSYAYVEAAFGPLAGYIVNWVYFFAWSIFSSAALLNVVADSLAIIFPAFGNPLYRGALFFSLIAVLIFVNVRSAKQGMGFVKLLTIIKLLPLFGIIIFGFSLVNTAHFTFNNVPSFKTFSNSTLILFFAFAGFETCLSVSGELKNPQRTIPLSILLGGVLILVVYLLLQFVTQGMLGANMAAYQNAPLAAVAEAIAGPVGATILLLTAAVSCCGNVSADILATPRILFAGARDGMFPRMLSKVHPRFATPYVSIIVYGSLIFIISISGGFTQLAVLATAAILLIYLAVVVATIKLRNQPKTATGKVFRMPGGLLFPVIGILSIIWVLTSLKQSEIISTLIFLAFVCILFFFTIKFKKKKVDNGDDEIH